MAPPRTGEAVGTSALSSLRHRDFAIFWSAALISNSGTWMQSITVPFVLFELTHSNTWVGAGAVFTFVPGLVVGPLAGTLADRFDRKRIIFCTQSVSMVVAVLLWLLWVADAATPWRLAGLLVVSGTAGGLNISAWQSFVPLLVPRESLISAVRLNSMQFTAARAFGPAAAGLVLRAYGPEGAFLGNAASFLLVLFALTLIHPRGQHIATGRRRFREEFRLGLQYVRRRPAMVQAIVTMVAMATFGSSVVQLAVGFSQEEFGTTESAYGFLIAAFGFGAIVGSVLLLAVADRVARSRTALTGVGLEVAGILVLSVAPSYAWGLVSLTLMGAAWVTCGVSLNTAIQSQVVDEFRGRVISMYLMGLQAGTPLGALVLGRLGDRYGLRPVVRGSGLVLACYLLFAILALAGLRAIDADSDPVAMASYTPAS
jgi:MFS family permease